MFRLFGVNVKYYRLVPIILDLKQAFNSTRSNIVHMEYSRYIIKRVLTFVSEYSNSSLKNLFTVL